eukprot:Skav235094  [mRNA]  locus=scaffold711:70939:84063:- [translate_table: standard]
MDITLAKLLPLLLCVLVAFLAAFALALCLLRRHFRAQRAQQFASWRCHQPLEEHGWCWLVECLRSISVRISRGWIVDHAVLRLCVHRRTAAMRHTFVETEARTFRELWRVSMGKDTEKTLGENYTSKVSTVFNFPHAFQHLDGAVERMRSSFNALINRGPEDNFMFTTILLLSVSVYMGVAFKDIAVIKMIKGTEANIGLETKGQPLQHPRFIFPAIFFIQLNEPIRLKRKRSGDVNDPMSQVRRRCNPNGSSLAASCFFDSHTLATNEVIMMITGFVQGALALMVHYNII